MNNWKLGLIEATAMANLKAVWNFLATYCRPTSLNFFDNGSEKGVEELIAFTLFSHFAHKIASLNQYGATFKETAQNSRG